MHVVILFVEHSIIGDYAKAIKADENSVDISFGAMTIRYKYKSPQVWMTNNWESYLIIHFGSPKEVVFHLSPNLPSFLSFSSKPPVVIKSGDHPVNYAVKPVEVMHCFIKMFSNPGETVIDAFAGRKSLEEKKATPALQPSPLAPVQSPQLISTPSPASLETSMDEFFQQLPQPSSTSTVPSSNQLVCIIYKQPAEKKNGDLF